MLNLKKRTAISKLYLGFSLSSFACLLALLMNACSPISPSLSKFANAPAAGPQAGSQQDDLSAFINEHGSSLDNMISLSYGTRVHTRVVNKSELQNSGLFLGPVTEISAADLSEIMRHGESEFNVNSQIKAMGTKMLTSDVYIYFVTMNLSLEKRMDLQNVTAANLEFCGTNLSKVCGSDFRIQLTQPSYSGDPAEDTNSQHPRNVLMQSLVGIVLEFQSN